MRYHFHQHAWYIFKCMVTQQGTPKSDWLVYYFTHLKLHFDNPILYYRSISIAWFWIGWFFYEYEICTIINITWHRLSYAVMGQLVRIGKKILLRVANITVGTKFSLNSKMVNNETDFQHVCWKASHFIACLFVNIHHTSDVYTLAKAVTMKNGVFWDVTPCGSCKNRRLGGT
jgi:hypothetical protein